MLAKLIDMYKTYRGRKRALYHCQSVLNCIPNINRGGCLISAYAIFLYFKKHAPKYFNENVVLVQFSRQFSDHLHNKYFIESLELNAVSATHFGISFDNGNTAYDSNGLITNLDYNYEYRLVIPNDMTFEFVFSALQDGTWNPDFKRELHIPTIENMLEITIGRYK